MAVTRLLVAFAIHSLRCFLSAQYISLTWLHCRWFGQPELLRVGSTGGLACQNNHQSCLSRRRRTTVVNSCNDRYANAITRSCQIVYLLFSLMSSSNQFCCFHCRCLTICWRAAPAFQKTRCHALYLKVASGRYRDLNTVLKQLCKLVWSCSNHVFWSLMTIYQPAASVRGRFCPR